MTLKRQTDPIIVGFVLLQRSKGPLSAGVNEFETMTQQIHGTNLFLEAHFDSPSLGISYFLPENTDVNYGSVMFAVRLCGSGRWGSKLGKERP